MQKNWSDLNELEGTLHVERDASLGHYRINIWFIHLFWKHTGGWEISFIDDAEENAFQIIFCDDKKIITD